MFLTTSGFRLVTGHCSDFPVADPDAVVDHALSERILVTLATDADTTAGKILVGLLQDLVVLEGCGGCASAEETCV